MSRTSPLRFPNTESPREMTTRAWILLGLNFLLPGSPQALAGNRQLGKFGVLATLGVWVFVILSPVFSIVMPPVHHFFVTWGPSLFVGQVVLFCYGLMWAFFTIDTLSLIKLPKTGLRARWVVGVVAVLGLAATAGTTLVTAWKGW